MAVAPDQLEQRVEKVGTKIQNYRVVLKSASEWKISARWLREQHPGYGVDSSNVLEGPPRHRKIRAGSNNSSDQSIPP
jgi:hypothetical protein